MLTVRGNIRVTGNLNLKPGIAAPGTSYLLDDLSAAPDVIMSPSKIFSSTYESTAIIRLRRTSDSAESDFTGAEITAGDDLTWIGSQTSFVSKIYDQSGNSKDAYQTDASQQSQYTDASGNRITMTDGNTAPQQTVKGMLLPALGFTGSDGAAIFRFNGNSYPGYEWKLLQANSDVYLAAALNRNRDAPSEGSGTPVIKINGTTLSPYYKGQFKDEVTDTDVTVRITDIDWSADSDWNSLVGYLTYYSDAKMSSFALYNSEPSSHNLDLIVTAFEAT